jgi:hypothetical protein
MPPNSPVFVESFSGRVLTITAGPQEKTIHSKFQSKADLPIVKGQFQQSSLFKTQPLFPFQPEMER